MSTKVHHQTSTAPILLIHGGAGTMAIEEFANTQKQNEITRICSESFATLKKSASASEAVLFAIEQLERSPLFNAGIGSTLCADGQARLSASFMESDRARFSAVSCVTQCAYPSKLARALQERSNRVLGPLGAQLLARELGIKPESPLTEIQIERWRQHFKTQVHDRGHDTVGAVALDAKGKLAAATSTGGTNWCSPERISDVSTVAGNYVSRFAAISATGIGEEIVDAALCARLETRVRDGKTIHEASAICLHEAQQQNHRYGWIAIDKQGNWSVAHTTEGMFAAAMAPSLSSPYLLVCT